MLTDLLFMENALFNSHLCEAELNAFGHFCNFSSFWRKINSISYSLITKLNVCLVYLLKKGPQVLIEFLLNECPFRLEQMICKTNPKSQLWHLPLVSVLLTIVIWQYGIAFSKPFVDV
jgi:hypothetical protein